MKFIQLMLETQNGRLQKLVNYIDDVEDNEDHYEGSLSTGTILHRFPKLMEYEGELVINRFY